MSGDFFVYGLIALNLGACVTYTWQGLVAAGGLVVLAISPHAGAVWSN